MDVDSISVESVKLGIRKVCDWILKYQSTLMSVALVAYGIFGMIYYYGEDQLYGVAINIAPIICGLLILFDKHKSVFWAVGLYAIGIGASKLIRNLPGIFSESMFTFIFNVVFTVMAGNLVYSGVRYIRGNARSILFVILGTTAFVVLTGISLAIDFEMSDDLAEFLYYDTGYLVNMGVYLLYMGLVWSEPVRKSTDASIALRLSSGIRGVDGTMKTASIHSYAVKGIVDYIEGRSSNDGPLEGPVYSEYGFSYRDKFTTNYASLQRWNGPEGEIYMILSDHNKGSFVGINSIRVKGVSVADGYLMIECADRGDAIFRIMDTEEEDGPITFSRPVKAEGGAA